MKIKAMVFLALLAGVFLQACAPFGSVKIGRLTADPLRFRNRTVHVNGVVTNSFGAIVAGAYQVQDDTGKIWVLSNGNVPPKGSRVNVSGSMMNGITIGGRGFGTGIREFHHRVKW